MKKTPLTLALLFLVEASARIVFGQSPISFNTRVGGDFAVPISRPDGTGAGEGFQAGLFLVNGSTLTPLSPFTTFRTNPPAARFFVQPLVEALVVPGHQGDKVTMRLRAWRGKDYESADIRGESKDFVLTLTGKGGLPVSLKGAQGFTMQPVGGPGPRPTNSP